MSIAPRRTRYAGILSGVPGDALSTRIDVQTIEADTCRATFDDGDTMLLHLKRHESLPGGGIRVVAEIGGARHEILLTRTTTSNLVVDYAGMHRDIALQGAARERGKAGSGAGRAAHASITSPMPARITEILVGASDLVDEGAPLLRLEAMKMVITLPSPRRCRIETVHVAAEQSVEAGERLISLADAGSCVTHAAPRPAPVTLVNRITNPNGVAVSLESDLTQYCDRLTFSRIDPAAIALAKHSLIDIIGVSLAGSRDAEVELLANVIEHWGGRPEARVIGRTSRLPAPSAALLNGAAARSLDFDDVADPLGTHPSVAIFPPLLAIAELRANAIDHQAFLTAYIAGLDLSIRLSRARRETLLESGRYDLCKVIAATAAAGILYGLKGEQLHHAMGIAYTSALGETQCMIDGAPTVFYQQGLVAANAVRAVVLASRGFTGAKDYLTGRWGYYSAFEPGSAIETISDGLGEVFANVDGVAFKPFPTCRPNTSAVALALELTKGERLSAAQIERIDIQTNQQIHDLVCAPIARKQAPESVVDARFSMAYNVATALATGDIFIDDFTEAAIRRPDILALSRKIHPRTDPDCERSELGTHGKIKIAIRLTDGRIEEGEVSYAKGNPKNPMSLDELVAKFDKCVAYAQLPYASQHRAAIVEWVLDRSNRNPSYANLAELLHAPAAQ